MTLFSFLVYFLVTYPNFNAWGFEPANWKIFVALKAICYWETSSPGRKNCTESFSTYIPLIIKNYTHNLENRRLFVNII